MNYKKQVKNWYLNFGIEENKFQVWREIEGNSKQLEIFTIVDNILDELLSHKHKKLNEKIINYEKKIEKIEKKVVDLEDNQKKEEEEGEEEKENEREIEEREGETNKNEYLVIYLNII